MISSKTIVVVWISIIMIGCASLDWDNAQKENSIVAYEGFMEKHPDSEFNEQARQEIERIYWDQVLGENTVESFQVYLQRYPKGRYVQMAKTRTQHLLDEQLIVEFSICNIDKIKKLIGEGAIVNNKTYEGMTSIKKLVEPGCREPLKILLSNDVDVNSKDPYGQTIIYYAALSGNAELVRRLIEASATVHDVDTEKNTLLMAVAQIGHENVVQVLLQSGSKLNIQNKYGATALMFAAQEGHAETMNVLLKSGADPNILTEQGETALMIAAFNGRSEAVDILIISGADPKITTKNSASALSFAIQQGHSIVEAKLKKLSKESLRKPVTTQSLFKRIESNIEPFTLEELLRAAPIQSLINHLTNRHNKILEASQAVSQGMGMSIQSESSGGETKVQKVFINEDGIFTSFQDKSHYFACQTTRTGKDFKYFKLQNDKENILIEKMDEGILYTRMRPNSSSSSGKYFVAIRNHLYDNEFANEIEVFHNDSEFKTPIKSENDFGHKILTMSDREVGASAVPLGYKKVKFHGNGYLMVYKYDSEANLDIHVEYASPILPAIERARPQHSQGKPFD